ncbi:TIR domain-containing protein [Bradyrhizobium sp. WSM1253]|uniref:TIR domain-containing protein n=1 Tax=Bradyrhizobium sp. WSM1253 TaxID=319003 RepID=UPI00025D2E3D|nr:nucleotide-binding protein [Bradyrhizobium sp. WSM1253]EIG62918.1 putative nucleotide-binding protein containing TIR-like domain [Bradyrhizobium sp. WSM1253]
MARINPQLIERLATRLGITPKAVYRHVQGVVNETGLERHLAALLLAMRNKDINVTRLSTADERAAVSGWLGGGHRRRDPEEPRPAEPARRAAAPAKKSKQRPTRGKTIFVVHGRDQALRDSMFGFLRAAGLEPIEWEEAVRRARRGANPFVGDLIERVMDQAQAVLVMFSPDDMVQLRDVFVDRHERNTEGKLQGQARPNVLFEAGLAMGAHAEKTVLVQVGHVKQFSDIGGRHMLRFNGSAASRHDLIGRLRMLRCDLEVEGRRDWLEVGTFAPTERKPAKKSKR